MNVRSIFLHVLGDALANVSVILAGEGMRFVGQPFAVFFLSHFNETQVCVSTSSMGIGPTMLTPLPL